MLKTKSWVAIMENKTKNHETINKKAEILAPAGSIDALKTAITNGADAVYLGLSSFSARAGATNFDIETLKIGIEYANFFGAKVYVAINTLIKNSEIDSAIQLAKQAWDCGVSAIIVQDIGLALKLKQKHPQIVLHASTQMGVHNLEGALVAQRLGMERVILSRETPLTEIQRISASCDVEIEHFVHGALCCGFSGNCYFSSLIAGKSGNRGRCMQLCRKPYLLSDESKSSPQITNAPTSKTSTSSSKTSTSTSKTSTSTSKTSTPTSKTSISTPNAQEGFWLSTRDTMLKNRLEELQDAGVCSFKIEGRLRRIEYVAEAVRIYKNAQNYNSVQNTAQNISQIKTQTSIQNTTQNTAQTNAQINSQEDERNLKLMFNRGNFATAHLDGVNHNIIYPKLQSHMGVKLGNVKSVYGTKAVLDCELSKRDGLKFLRNGQEVGHALAQNDGYETSFVGNVRVGDAVHLTDSAKLNAQIAQRERKMPLHIRANFLLSKGICELELSARNQTKKYTYPIELQVPKNSPISIADIKDCFSALGDTNFSLAGLDFSADSDFFATKSALKGLRRQFTADFERHLIDSFERPTSMGENVFATLPMVELPDDCKVVMCSPADAQKYAQLADFVIIKPSNYAEFFQDIKTQKFAVNKAKYMLDLPVIAFGADISLIQEIANLNAFDMYVANNIYALMPQIKGKILLGYKMNMLNNVVDFAKTASIEGNERANPDNLTYCFGRPDLMQTVHCYYKLQRGCDRCNDQNPITLTDDHNETYQIKRQKVHNCYNLLVSALPINLTHRQHKKSLFDAVNLSKNETDLLDEFLRNYSKENGSITVKSLPQKRLD